MLLAGACFYHIKIFNKPFRVHIFNKTEAFPTGILDYIGLIVEEQEETVILVVILVAEFFLFLRELLREIYSYGDEIIHDLFCYRRVVINTFLQCLSPWTSLTKIEIDDHRFFLGFRLFHARI